MNGNKKERLRGEIRPMADRGSAAASQFPEPDGSEVESSTAGKSRQWEKKKIPASSKKRAGVPMGVMCQCRKLEPSEDGDQGCRSLPSFVAIECSMQRE